MTNDRPSGWQGWISLLALLPLALASARLLPVTALPVAATGAAALALDALSRRTWAERAAALEAAALVSVGTLAGYATAVGVRPPLDVPALLAGSLLLGSTVVAWAVDKALPGHGAPASAQLATWLSTPQWNRAMALLLVILGVCLVKGAWAFGSAVPYTWLVASYSYLPLVPLCVLCLPAGRVARPTTVLALMAVLVMAVWDFASTEVVLALDEPLTWPDLMVRFEDPSSFRILAEGLRSWSALLLVLGVFGGVAGLSRLLVRLRPAALGWTLARVVGLVLFSGRLLIQGQTVIEPRLAARYLTAASAPWSPVHTPPQYDRQIDMAVAREVRRALEPPLWEEGPAPLIAELAGRYRGRSVVLVLLESHRASDVAGLGEGSSSHQPVSPRLSELAEDGLLFTNYFQAHRPTHSAMWTLVSGLPYVGARQKPVYSGPEAARLGRLPELAALGYQCDWIRAFPSTKFDNWHRLMQQAGVRYWINAPETAGLARTYWTAWGMADEDFLEVARRRFESVNSTGRPMFLGLLTVSNHRPYSFPDEIDGVPLTHDFHGGMRYADHALGRFVDHLRQLPEPQRPIVFITADTTDSEGLMDAEPMGTANLEGLRIPGLLLLPDRAMAGQKYEGLFAHEDALDLLYLLVAPSVSSPKFLSRHRVVVSSTGMLLTQNAYLDPHTARLFEIRSRWGLVPIADSPDRERLLAAREYLTRLGDLLWTDGRSPAAR